MEMEKLVCFSSPFGPVVITPLFLLDLGDDIVGALRPNTLEVFTRKLLRSFPFEIGPLRYASLFQGCSVWKVLGQIVAFIRAGFRLLFVRQRFFVSVLSR